jgi:hypothetical protein
MGRQGLMSIAVVCAHISQIVMDGFLASYWSDKFDPEPIDKDDLVDDTKSINGMGFGFEKINS